MDVGYKRKVWFRDRFTGLFFIIILILIPFKLWSQTIAIPQECNESQSWIARWTLSSVSGPHYVDNMFDGDKTNINKIIAPGPWAFNIDFGIIRHLSGIKIYSGSRPYSPRTYEILVSKDNLLFTSVKSDILPYIPDTPGGYEQLIDFNGYYEAKYVRIIFTDAYIDETTFSSSQIQLGEVNFLQCGVDPIMTQKVTPGTVILPSVFCSDAISKDIQRIINTYIPGQTDAIKGSKTLKVNIDKVRGLKHTLVRGDRILIIQMQNAVISETNSMAYGDGVDKDLIASGWTDVQNTGEYEFGIVESISGNTIQLTQPLQKSYSADGVFQVVYSPVYDNVTITDTIKAEVWDGFCGGIVTFDARTLNLNNQTIDVSAQGFRKGKMTSSLLIQYVWGSYCTDKDWYCSTKGEGIAGAPRGSYPVNSRRLYSIEDPNLYTGGSLGRGAPGNAGGGGMDNNSGGGGGANIGSGGQGGASWGGEISGDMTNYWTTTSPDGGLMDGMGYYPNGGMGGTGIGTADPFRTLLGGAGGNGFQNENHGTEGGNGGGIILVTARVVKGSGYFKADGVSSGNSTNDGAGGGGAGGTIVFGFDDQTGATINYSAKGGNGGGVNYDFPMGPGGGGGGGAIIVSATSASMDIKGGMNGVNTGTLSQWGANKGMDGNILVSGDLTALYTYSCDHGDAPRSFGDAAHLLKADSLKLGLLVDAEASGFYPPPHDRDALGDNDDDGVVLPFDTLSTVVKNYKVKVMVNNPLNLKNVIVCGWIDFNGNGRFDENEKTSISGPLSGENVLTWTGIPSDIKEGDSYARFRISTGDEAMEPTGVAPNGEVEDYIIKINEDPAAKYRGLTVPNAFLPDNTDNLPIVFLPIGLGLKEYTLMIFDLWGNLIWTNSDLDLLGKPLNGWDGKDKHGISLPTDTYIWRIKAVLIGNKPWKGMKMPNGTYHTEGPLTIIR